MWSCKNVVIYLLLLKLSTENQNMCLLFKERSILLRERVQNSFFSELCPFFDLEKLEHFVISWLSLKICVSSKFLRTKSVTKKEMNTCMAVYDPGGIRTRAVRLINQYHNH